MALSNIPGAGAKLRGSVLSSLITEVRMSAVQKGSDEIVSNSVTLQNDDELLLPVAANCTYRWQADITFQAGAAADFKWAFTFPTGATCTFVGAGWDTALAFVPSGSGSLASGSGIQHGGAGIGSNRGLIIRGYLTTSANAGNLQFQWAQTAAVVENTVVKAGSWLNLVRVA